MEKKLIKVIGEEPIYYCALFHPTVLMDLDDVILDLLWKEDDIMLELERVLWLNKICLN